ncbi:PTS sugar transporter subunit IIC [Photobacterium rosenbergii]|uniref:Permease IIC component n=2 Tax=Photobacterium rosenbergii TaxID=294936 RepID=A0A2T3N9Z9_9GAMM|nr:PTS sugar transporter subunit IIC [Photobacterium rosenbergii]
MERHVQPIAAKLEKQPHIASIRDGFILVLPFLIIGSFMLILLCPPFNEDTTNSFGQAWWAFADSAGPAMWRIFQMSFNAIAIFVSASIAYNLAKKYKREPLPAAFLSLMTFFLICGPYEGDQMSLAFVGGSGLFPAIFIAFYTVEITRLLERLGLYIRLPKEVPSAVAESLNIIIPVLAVLLTLYPVTLWIETSTGLPVPQLIMDAMAPLIQASDSLVAIVLVVLATHLLWFAGINGSLVLMQLWTPFLLSNMAANFAAREAGEAMPFVITNSFWDFYVVHGATGGLLALVILLMRSRSVHMRSIGKIGAVPAFFSIGEPVVYGLPIVMNPLLFVPLILCPLANAVIAYLVVDFGIVGKMFLMAPWTTPAPIGAFLATGGDGGAIILSLGLIVLNVFIYYPFFKVFEKQCLEREKAQAEEEQGKEDTKGKLAIN